MSAIPIANGGLLRRALDLPDFRNSAVAVKKTRGYPRGGNVLTLGNFLREVMRLNMCNFRVFGPGRDAVQQVGGDLRSPAGKSGLLLLAKVNCLTNSPASNWSKSGSNCAPAAASAWNG
jgi:hypothetical protein